MLASGMEGVGEEEHYEWVTSKEFKAKSDDPERPPLCPEPFENPTLSLDGIYPNDISLLPGTSFRSVPLRFLKLHLTAFRYLHPHPPTMHPYTPLGFRCQRRLNGIPPTLTTLFDFTPTLKRNKKNRLARVVEKYRGFNVNQQKKRGWIGALAELSQGGSQISSF
ncbi:hypothetical protein CDAR_473221 [Caerostris darwini]|uniref:Uncharacterized protein n=1 Tax=Caerostris darwini TaxID=1538125 RepID=A0AAV4PQ92_9ARAC|nr:hypothetical protein CDAR_473101 [Caerostris darwini]GIX97397.1 hypothetical protein CDAR_473221 [Caerostris darwini]